MDELSHYDLLIINSDWAEEQLANDLKKMINENIIDNNTMFVICDSHQKDDRSSADILIQFLKDSHKLIWHSDCYYNPDDEWSIASVSCLNIERNDFCFKIWCTKKLDEMLDRPYRTYGICFSPAGNGKYSKNLNTGLTLQDDFVTHIYQPLLNKNKVLKR